MRLPEGVEVTTGDGEPQLVFTPESASRGGRGGGGAASEGEWALRLRKALYGTKQASNVWHESIDSFLRSLGYRPCLADPCVYVRTSVRGERMLLGLFVDDIVSVFAPADGDEWESLRARLFGRYAMKDLGDAQRMLGMHLTRD